MIFVQTKEKMDEEINFFIKNNEIISIVPTMGNLHDGHMSLINLAKINSTKVVVSIFINPLQFGKNEDFENYPRTIDADKKKLEKSGCDLLFFPKNDEEIFPKTNNFDVIQSGKLGNILCGKKRPGHFNGVLSVVNQLFKISKPNVAIFGIKDYQQQILIKKMSKNVFPNLKIITGPIIREKNGLALSSRNNYLNEKEKLIAPFFYKTLQKGVEIFKASKDIDFTINSITNLLLKKNFEVEYVEIRNQELEKINSSNLNSKLVLLASIKIGTTKLIDNIEFN